MGKRFEGQVAWITGGGSGIGRELALLLGQEGAIVAVSGRRLDRLQEVVQELEKRGARAIAVPCDVTREDQLQDAVGRIVNDLKRLDLVIANAGFAVSGTIESLSAEDWRRQLETNVIGVAMTIRHGLPHLKTSGGRIGIIGSVAGMITYPKAGAYSASKYAVRAIGQTLSMELAGSGVSCTTVHPGYVETEIAQVDNQGKLNPAWRDRRPRVLLWPADRAARVILDAVHRRKWEVVFTAHGKVAAFLGKHTPGLVYHALGWKKGR